MCFLSNNPVRYATCRVTVVSQGLNDHIPDNKSKLHNWSGHVDLARKRYKVNTTSNKRNPLTRDGGCERDNVTDAIPPFC